MRQGDFGEFTTQIFDPTTATGTNGARTAFTNNVIPSGRINPVAAAYAALYPEPNRPGTAANFATNGLRPYNYHAAMGRIDHNLGASSRLTACSVGEVLPDKAAALRVSSLLSTPLPPSPARRCSWSPPRSCVPPR